MNLFVAVMLLSAALGLADKMFNMGWGLSAEFDKGMAAMGSLALSTVGFYCVGVAYVQNHAAEIAAVTEGLPFDPSLIIGCLLAPDMGALPVALKLAHTEALGVFTGAMVAGGLGMTICFQLPVFLASVQKHEIPELMQGFIFGLITLPSGLIAGGLLLGLNLRQLLFNMLPVLVLCVVLVISFLKLPRGTTNCLIVAGTVIRMLSFLLFGIVIFGVFVPQFAIVDDQLIREMLYLVVRMVIVACGGLVLSRIALQKLKRPIDAAAARLKINRESVVGLVLSCTQSLAMLPLFSQMDRRGKILNAAFSACGAYLVGGQMAFVSTLVPGGAVTAYIVSKGVSGVCALVVAEMFTGRMGKLEGED